MQPFDTRSLELAQRHQPTEILDFGSGSSTGYVQSVLERIPTAEVWCVDFAPVEESERIHFVPSQVFTEAGAELPDALAGKCDLAHSAFVFHEVCDDWERGEEIGGIHTAEAGASLTSISRCLRRGATFELVDFVACEFYEFLQASGRQSVLDSPQYKKAADTVYDKCISQSPRRQHIASAATVVASAFDRDEGEAETLLQRLFIDYPRLPGREIAKEKDEFVRLMMHLRKYKDHHTRCPLSTYHTRLKETGFTDIEEWTPDGMRYQIVCRKE